MSVLIKGMEMPESCCCCTFFEELEDDSVCTVCLARKYNNSLDHVSIFKRADWCPLIEVPKHGRLIDGIAIRHKLLEVWRTSGNYTMDYKNGIEDANEAIRLAPTIIEADGKDINVTAKEDG